MGLAEQRKKAVPFDELIVQLSATLDPTLARSAIESYVAMQKRFLAGDWRPSEVDGGRFCEAVSRCLLQLDAGTITYSQSPGEIKKKLLDDSRPHHLAQKDRSHLTRVLDLVYEFRSDRDVVHISALHTANQMDSMLVIHVSKWLLAELLRLAWKQDQKVIGEMISRLVQLEHALIHELDGRPLVMSTAISAPEEVLLLLSHAPSQRLSRSEIRSFAPNQKAQTITTAVKRLIDDRQVRESNDGQVALTSLGQKRIMEQIVPKLNAVG